MRTLVAVMVLSLPLIQAQDSQLLKSVEPDYDKYSPELATDFHTVITPVTVTVLANGKPGTFNSVPLPMAVVMALKDYEFQPPGKVAVPHGRIDLNAGSYEVTLNVPIRQGKFFISQNEVSPQDSAQAEVIVAGPNGKPAVRVVRAHRAPPGVVKGMVLRRVQPIYPESAREARVQGKVTLEALISKEGYVEIRRVISGPFPLIEAAYDAVKQWTYKPFLEDHQPVDVVADIEIVFALN